METSFKFALPKDECGIISIYDKGNIETATMACYGLTALQHRGQESAGIAISNNGFITIYKDTGLVRDVFNTKILSLLKGDMCIGHVKYSSTKERRASASAQPYIIDYSGGKIAVATNGALTNSDPLREDLKSKGVKFNSELDSELIARLVANLYESDIDKAIEDAISRLEGGFAATILTKDRIYGFRDRNGIRPLSLARLKNGYAMASETVAFDVIGAQFCEEIAPGRITVIDRDELRYLGAASGRKSSVCAFEFVYFARPDSNMNGLSVYKARENAGRQLAKEHPANADCVIGVPDSGTPAAIGYASESGIPYCLGLIKNRYIGRTFIQPTQALRELDVKLKLNPMRDLVYGKSVVLIDDSIVRGTTSLQIIEAIKSAGAREVHMRVASPEIRNLCRFGGIDINNVNDLISNRYTTEDIGKLIGADSIGFISAKGLMKALSENCEGFCCGCVDGIFPNMEG